MYRERSNQDSELIELVLNIFRNLLLIPDPPSSRVVTDTRSNMHDSLVLAFQKYALAVNSAILQTYYLPSLLIEIIFLNCL